MSRIDLRITLINIMDFGLPEYCSFAVSGQPEYCTIAVSGQSEYCTIFHFLFVCPFIRSSVTGVTSQLFSIIWWFTMKTIYFLNAYHLCWWYSQVKPNRAQYSPVQPSKAQYSSLQSNTEQNSTEDLSAAQLQSSCSLVKPSRAQYSPV